IVISFVSLASVPDNALPLSTPVESSDPIVPTLMDLSHLDIDMASTTPSETSNTHIGQSRANRYKQHSHE
ncbi:1939_t:CDS:1, partial [Dentiscutata heterogama]